MGDTIAMSPFVTNVIGRPNNRITTDSLSKNSTIDLKRFVFRKPKNSIIGCLYDLKSKRNLSGNFFVDMDASEIQNPQLFGARVLFQGGRMGLVNRRGQIQSSINFINTNKRNMVEPLGFIAAFDQDGYAVFRTDVVPEKRGIQSAGALMKGAKHAEKGSMFFKPGKWGVINSKGDLLIPPIYKRISKVINGKVFAQNFKGKYGVLSVERDTIIPFVLDGFEVIEQNGETFYKSIKNHEKWCVVNPDGKVIAPSKYQVVRYLNQGYASVRRNKKWTLVNPEGKEVVAPQFDRIGKYCDGLVAVRKEGLWGYMDSTGAMVVEPQFRFAGTPTQGLMPVKIKGMYGVINRAGEVVIKPRFQNIINSRNGTFIVKRRKGFGLIDSKGKWLIHVKKGLLVKYSSMTYLKNEFILAKSPYSKSVYNATGKLIDDGVSHVETWEDTYVSYKKTGLFITIRNKHGKLISKKEYYGVKGFNEGCFTVYNDQGYFLIDTTGKQLLSGRSYFNLGVVSNGLISCLLYTSDAADD